MVYLFQLFSRFMSRVAQQIFFSHQAKVDLKTPREAETDTV